VSRCSHGLPCAARTSPQVLDLPLQCRLVRTQSSEIGTELASREVPWFEAEHPCAPDAASSDQTITLEPSKRGLDSRKGRAQHSRQLPWVALLQELERDQHASPGRATEWIRSYHDHCYRSYDHLSWSISRVSASRRDGRIKSVAASPGIMVQAGSTLVELEDEAG
jgi:hypothetical protein